MARAAAKRRTKKRANWALRIILIALFAFVAIEAVRLCSEIIDTQQQIVQIDNANATKEANNESKEQQKNNVEGILEDEAYDSGHYKAGQQIYQRGEG